MAEKWFENSYRRNLVDMHIEDWDESFLSKLDAKKYVDLLKKAQVQGAMVYANSHVGYCYWPTKHGRMHKGLKGHDFLGEFIDLCHKEGMKVIIYFTLIYDNWAFDQDAAWRIVDVNGKTSREKTERILDIDSSGVVKTIGFNSRARYGVCCPNSEGYRQYVAAQLEDLASRYKFEGMFLDMTFWPDVCYCDSCRKRYAEEVGGTMPTIIDWRDEKWKTFQKKREEWLRDFAHFATGELKKHKPEATVDHQFSTSLQPWVRGSTEAVAEASDYCGGDFYGGYLEQTFICKLLYNLTQNRPFEFHTSRCYPNLRDHTTMKTKEMLELHNATALAHGGAFLFIDAVDPVGTLNPKVYETLGEIFEESKRYEPYIGGEMCQDIGIYFSLTSKLDLSDNGKGVQQSSMKLPHRDAAVGAAKKLQTSHRPYGIISKSNLKNADRHKIIVLPDVLMLDDEEKAAIIGYVKNGGSLYASGGRIVEIIPELFGATVKGETKEIISYIAPVNGGEKLFPDVEKEYPLTVYKKQPVVEAEDENEVKATIILPYTNPNDGIRFASIHSDPPGITTDNPALIYRSYGKGKVIWSSAPLEAAAQPPHKTCFLAMIDELAGVEGSYTFISDGPGVVEMTAFHQPEKKRYIINFLNMQEEYPVVPVRDMKIDFAVEKAGEKVKVTGVELLPGKTALEYTSSNGVLETTVPEIAVFAMIAIYYE